VLCRLIHNVNKSLSEHGEKLDEATKKEVQAAIDAAKAVDESADNDVLKAKISELQSASMKIGQAMYKKDGSSGAAAEEGGAKEAEYEDKKDEKK
jgi:molecular chaperone DnaK